MKTLLKRNSKQMGFYPRFKAALFFSSFGFSWKSDPDLWIIYGSCFSCLVLNLGVLSRLELENLSSLAVTVDLLHILLLRNSMVYKLVGVFLSLWAKGSQCKHFRTRVMCSTSLILVRTRADYWLFRETCDDAVAVFSLTKDKCKDKFFKFLLWH